MSHLHMLLTTLTLRCVALEAQDFVFETREREVLGGKKLLEGW